MRTIGFTTTIPLEILIAAKVVPVDLNNLFIAHPSHTELLAKAESDGFPRNICSWIKGMYGAVISSPIKEVIAVTQGDCSNTQALMEALQFRGVAVIPFFYPYDRDRKLLLYSIKKLMHYFKVDEIQCAQAKKTLDRIRKKVHRIDELTWKENIVSGDENHYFQVSTSDMNHNPDHFESELDTFLASLSQRAPFKESIRLGYIGVPPLINDLYSFVESLEARIVFNEMQRQFSMPYPSSSLLEQYLRYTYPYDVFTRIQDITTEIKKRAIDGIIHYVQSFCFRQIEDMVIKKSLPLPVLTIEGDHPAPLDARNKTRIEVFIEMLRERKRKKNSGNSTPMDFTT